MRVEVGFRLEERAGFFSVRRSYGRSLSKGKPCSDLHSDCHVQNKCGEGTEQNRDTNEAYCTSSTGNKGLSGEGRGLGEGW